MDYVSIEDLDLSVRSYNCLKRAGINSLEDIIEKTEEDMIKIRNLGRKNLEEIRWKLNEFGFSFREDEPRKITGKEKLVQKIIEYSNEDLEYIFVGGSCPNEFDLYDEKSSCEGAFCSSCWRKALEMEYNK